MVIKRARILLVEDNQEDVALLVHALKRAGFGDVLFRVKDGAEALDYLLGTADRSRPSGVPDVVLLDLHLPLVDGLEVLRRLRADRRTKNLPVVVLLGSAPAAGKSEGLSLGASAILDKPVRPEELKKVLAELKIDWESWRGEEPTSS